MIDKIKHEELRERFNPDGSVLRIHQLRLLEMLKYLDNICRKNNISYWLGSGSLLGAVRHGGFIPWDDDVDIEMLKVDYDKFLKVMYLTKNDKYVLQTHDTDPCFFAPFAKLRDLNSCLEELNGVDLHYKYKGAFIDIFPIEPSSTAFLLQISGLFQRILYNISKRISNFLLCKIITTPLFFFNNSIVFPVLSFVSRIRAKDCYRYVHGITYYSPRYDKDIFPLKEMVFEGYSFLVPFNSDEYLRKIYGDYKTLPNLEDLHIHTLKIESYSSEGDINSL